MARAVAALRDLELSLPAIRALLAADEPGDRTAILAAERRRLEARTARLQRALHRLSMLAASHDAPDSGPGRDGPGRAGDTSSACARPRAVPVPHRSGAAPCPRRPRPHAGSRDPPRAGCGPVQPDLGPARDRGPDRGQDDEMVDTAHASAWHWRQVGNAANAARGHWLLARVYAVLGRGEPAVHHARRANDGARGWAARASRTGTRRRRPRRWPAPWPCSGDAAAAAGVEGAGDDARGRHRRGG